MHSICGWLLLLAVLAGGCQATSTSASATEAAAQDAPPTPEHAWLLRLVGDWEFKIEVAAPAQESAPLGGRESVRAIGDLWVLSDVQASMPGGGQMSAAMTLGFDPKRQRFVGTWIDSATNYIWRYEGSLDAGRKILTLDTEGPDFTDPTKLARFRDAIEIVDANHRRLSSSLLGPDGSWTVFNTVHYTRRR